MKTKAKRNKGGRPSKHSPEIEDEICRRIATSSDGLRKICESNERFPPFSKVFEWLQKFPEFRDKYARAREAQMELMSEEIIQIADDSSQDVTVTERGMEVPNYEFIQRSRLRVDSRKWLMSKLAPKKYGDKVDVTSDGKPVTPFVIEVRTEEAKKALENL